MKILKSHHWPTTIQEAREIQENLCLQKIPSGKFKKINFVAGCDVSFTPKEDRLFAGVVVLQLENLEIVEEQWSEAPVTFPYVPGFLAFREIPALLLAFEQIKQPPDLLICDGQGEAHPRRMGIASHLGMLLDLPTIGCGKTRLCGEHEPVPSRKGSWVPLVEGEETIGRVVRTRTGVKPVYVSVGHKINIESATSLILKTASQFRLPEPIRRAHQLVNRIRMSPKSGQN